MADLTPAQLAAQISSVGHNVTVQIAAIKTSIDELEGRVTDLESSSNKGSDPRLKIIEAQLAKLVKDVAALSKKK